MVPGIMSLIGLFCEKNAPIFLNSSRQLRAVKFRSLDPPYLLAKPQIPVYASLQFDVKSRDFVILERFPGAFRFVALTYVSDDPSFPLPARRTTYRLYPTNSTQVSTEFTLLDYHRVYRVNNLKAIHLPLLLDVLYQNLPEAVELSVRQSDPKSDEDRYVPQLEVHALQDELSKLSK